MAEIPAFTVLIVPVLSALRRVEDTRLRYAAIASWALLLSPRILYAIGDAALAAVSPLSDCCEAS